MSPKTVKDKYYDLQKYTIYLSRQKKPISCSFCQNKVLPKFYEKHCSSTHQLNPKIQCVWCQGKTHWPNKLRHKYGQHLLECAQKYIKSIQIPMVEKTPPISYTLFDIKPVVKARHFLGHKKISFSSDRTYKSIWPLKLNVSNLYQSDSLNRAVAAMQKYLEIYKKMDVYHVMVRGVALSSFIQLMDADHGKTRTFDFFCWCNGGRQPNYYYRQHRHMIIVSPKGHFKPNIWDKVKPSSKPPSNYTCKLIKRIKSPIHFANTILYVCNRKSRCAFSFSRQSDSNKNHYYIESPLPAQALIVLILQYDGGVIDWMKQTHQNMSEKFLISAPVKNIRKQWHLRINDTPKIPKHLILPMAKDFIPVQQVTPHFICLNEGKKIYFEQLETPLPDQEWIERHMAGGNLFFDTVAHETWTLRPRYQRFLNATQPIMDSKNLELATQKTEMNQLKTKVNELTVQNSKITAKMERISEIESNINELKEKIEHMNATLSELKTKMIQLKIKEDINHLELGITNARYQIHNLKRKHESLQDE